MRVRVLNDAYAIFSSSDFHYKSICCGYSFELPQQVDLKTQKLLF